MDENIYIYIDIVNQTLDRLYNNDHLLISGDASERAIQFHFAKYLEDIINCIDIFDGLNVDCEYNRNLVDEKNIRQ